MKTLKFYTKIGADDRLYHKEIPWKYIWSVTKVLGPSPNFELQAIKVETKDVEYTVARELHAHVINQLVTGEETTFDV